MTGPPNGPGAPGTPGAPAPLPAVPPAPSRRSSADPVVTVRSLVRRYGDVTEVAGIDFDVRRGEMFGLIGPDGAGKTTTLRMVLGLLKPDSGEAGTCGLSPLRERRRLSSRVGYLSQRFSLYGDLTLDENVTFFAEIHSLGRSQSVLRKSNRTQFLPIHSFSARCEPRRSWAQGRERPSDRNRLDSSRLTIRLL